MKRQQVFHFFSIAAIMGLLLLTACGSQAQPERVDVVRVGVLSAQR